MQSTWLTDGRTLSGGFHREADVYQQISHVKRNDEYCLLGGEKAKWREGYRLVRRERAGIGAPGRSFRGREGLGGPGRREFPCRGGS